MSVLVSASSLSKTFGAVSLYDGLSLSIHEGERVALIGPNGSGKTTLMKALAGSIEMDEGKIIRTRGLHIEYVPQKSDFDPNLSILDTIKKSAAGSHHSEYEAEIVARIMAGKIGFEDEEQLAGELSGGWQKRLTIACALATESDLYLFDEPTNHLDLKGTLWLEDLLKNANFTWMLVSHDRKFINSTAKTVIEINKIFPEGCHSSKGNYEDYLISREEFLDGQEKYSASLANKVRRETEWLSRGPKARTTKAKYRIDSAHSMQDELSEVKSRLRKQTAQIDFSASGRKTKKLIELKEVTKAFESKKIVTNFSTTLVSKVRVGIVGENGSGKSTLLKLIQGQVPLDSGSIDLATNLNIVYFDQHRASLNQDWTLARALSETGDSVIYRGRSIHVASWARKFLFKADDLKRPVKNLSGGEQARVLIANLMLKEADVLLLDEPTNDLDIDTLEILEESLISFPGALMLITHDRYMLERVCNTFIGLDGNGGNQVFSSYEQWQNEIFRGKKKAAKEKGASSSSKKEPAKKHKKLSYKDQRDFDTIEERIATQEAKIDSLKQSAVDPTIASDSSKLGNIYKDITTEEGALATLYERWGELESMVSPS